jgi:hypothetical protein
MSYVRSWAIHMLSLLEDGVEFLSFSDSYFARSAAFSISTITPSFEVQIRQNRSLWSRARKDLQLWYSNFLYLTSLGLGIGPTSCYCPGFRE